MINPTIPNCPHCAERYWNVTREVTELYSVCDEWQETDYNDDITVFCGECERELFPDEYPKTYQSVMDAFEKRK